MTVLVIALIGLGLILGFFSRQQAFKKLGRVLLFAAFSPILFGIGKNFFYQLTVVQKLIVILIAIPTGIVILLRILLSKELFNDVMGRFIYDGTRFAIVLPFRIIASIIRKYK